MNRKAREFIADIFRVCKKHKMVLIQKNDIDPVVVKDDLTADDLNYFKKCISSLSSKDDAPKNPKKKYKFYKPEDKKGE
jgi:hypothetical protein